MIMNQEPRTVWVHFNRINVARKDPDIWTVHMSDRCIQTKEVDIRTPLVSIYRGPKARQPRAYFKGKAVVEVLKNKVILHDS